MTRKNLLSSQVKRLLTSLSDQGNQHLTEVETDLVQTTYLLSEAIEKLGASFMAIHAGVSAQQEILDQLLSGTTMTPDIESRLVTLRGDVTQHINAAVTGLQFQDMTSQLIGRTVRRIAGLRDVLGAVGSSGAVLIADTEADELIAHKIGLVINRHLADRLTPSDVKRCRWRRRSDAKLGVNNRRARV